MRIISNDADQYIKALAHSISRDPASLEKWRCLHIEMHPNAEFSAEMLLKALESEYKEADCDAVICHDNDILLIGRAPDMDILNQVQQRMSKSIPEEFRPQSQLHDLFYGWRDIRKILLDKVSDANDLAMPDDSADFGEMSALADTFDEARKLRKSRNPLHILLVEDDDITRRLVTGLFKEHYAIFAASDAQEALVNYMLHAPDIVFLDINLPDKNGFQVLRQILSHDPEAYVVMFSGNSYLDNITHALSAGASGFIAKPFSKERMLRYIEDCAFGR